VVLYLGGIELTKLVMSASVCLADFGAYGSGFLIIDKSDAGRPPHRHHPKSAIPHELVTVTAPPWAFGCTTGRSDINAQCNGAIHARPSWRSRGLLTWCVDGSICARTRVIFRCFDLCVVPTLVSMCADLQRRLRLPVL
jgi:hypothetical protein